MIGIRFLFLHNYVIIFFKLTPMPSRAQRMMGNLDYEVARKL